MLPLHRVALLLCRALGIVVVLFRVFELFHLIPPPSCSTIFRPPHSLLMEGCSKWSMPPRPSKTVGTALYIHFDSAYVSFSWGDAE
jgi:hypothetical protein